MGSASSGRPVATSGELVCGLASPMPPQPFVGELGDPEADAAQAITDPLLGAAGHARARVPRVSIGGRRLATTAMRAAPLGGDPSAPVGLADTMTGAMIARISGLPIARTMEPSRVQPTSAMTILGGVQQRVKIAGASVPAVGPGALDGGDASGPDAVPPRTSFGEPSRALEILSRCSPARRRDLVPPACAVLVGDPVNVVTGAVVTDAVDFSCITPSFEFRRQYASDRCDRRSTLGPGWTHGFDQALWLEPGRVVLRDEDGREIEFDCFGLPGRVARAGDRLDDATGRLQLVCRGHLRWELHDRGRIRQFGPIAGEGPHERDRGMARLVRVVRTHEPTIELAYDRSARLHELRMGDRSMLTIEYAEAVIVALWTPVGERLHRHATFEYSPAGDLVATTDPLGQRRQYEYVQHLLVRETQRAGGSVHYGYDGAGSTARCVRTWGDDGRFDRSLEYDGNETIVVDGLGHTSSYRGNELGLVTEVVDPLGDRTRFRYDDALRLVEVRDPDGTRTIDTYDERGNLVQRKGPDGATWKLVYDAADRPIEGIDAMGGQWRYAYDGSGRLVRVEDPLGHIVRFEYEDGRLQRIVDPLGQVIATTMDEHARVVALALPGRAAFGFEYDAFGRIAVVVDPTGERLACIHDGEHRPVAIESATAAVRMQRDAEGWVVRLERDGVAWDIRRDPFGAIVALHAEDIELAYTHDVEGRLVAVQERSEPLLAISRDPRGLVESFTRADGAAIGVQHKPRTQRIERLVAPDGVTRIGWDAAGRIVAVEHSDGASSTFEYRPDGLLVRADNEQCECRFDRDVRGAVVRQVVGAHSIETAALDHAGRRHGLDLGDTLRVSYLRGADGQIERIAAVGDDVHDLRVERGRDVRIERVVADTGFLELHRDGWDRLRTVHRITGRAAETTESWPRDTAAIVRCGVTARDALHRALRGASGVRIWDEDRLLQEGSALLLDHPDTGVPIATWSCERFQLALPDERTGHDDDARARWFARCFPLAAIDTRVPTPAALLAQHVRHRAWAPEVRPVPGTSPWNPDAWTTEWNGPPCGDGRLDLLHIFGGRFPRHPLRPSAGGDENGRLT